MREARNNFYAGIGSCLALIVERRRSPDIETCNRAEASGGPDAGAVVEALRAEILHFTYGAAIGRH